MFVLSFVHTPGSGDATNIIFGESAAKTFSFKSVFTEVSL